RTKELVLSFSSLSDFEEAPHLRRDGSGIRLYETTWHDDFSKVRNECISYAAGDWILSIDADEVLTELTQHELLPFLVRQPFQDVPVVFSFEVKNLARNPQAETTFYKHTLFRNGFGIKYIRPVHEHVFYPGPGELKDI